MPDYQSLIGGLDLYKSYQELVTPDINYDILQMGAAQKELQAENLSLQVEQEANRLREEYIEAVGTAQYGAARRGVKVGEGNIQQNIEESAGNIGKDIQTARENVEYKQGILRRGAKRLRTSAKYQKELDGYKRTSRALGSLGTIGSVLDSFAPQSEADAMKLASKQAGIASNAARKKRKL